MKIGDWKIYVLGVIAAAVVTIASNWSSSRVDVLDDRAQAQQRVISTHEEKLRDVDAMRVMLARIEAKLDAAITRLERVERKMDAPQGRKARSPD